MTASREVVWEVARHAARAFVTAEPREGAELVRSGAALGARLEAVRRDDKDALVAALVAGESAALLALLSALPALAKTPTVIHIAAGTADASFLRQAGAAYVFSAGAQAAYDNAYFAHVLAAQTHSAVVHVFEDVDGDVKRADGVSSVEVASAAVAVDAAAVDKAYAAAGATLGRKLEPFHVHGEAGTDLAVVLGSGAAELAATGTQVLEISLLRPLLAERLVGSVPASVERIAVLERGARATRLPAAFVDVATAFQQVPDRTIPTITPGTLGAVDGKAADSLAAVLGGKPGVVGSAAPAPAAKAVAPRISPHERAYELLLDQVFGEQLELVNTPGSEQSPEFALGRVFAALESEDKLADAVASALVSGVPDSLAGALREWQSTRGSAKKAPAAAAKLQEALAAAPSSATVDRIRSHADNIARKSRWIVGHDAWAYDTGMGGVHHAIASGRNVNLLIFDTVPYSARDQVPVNERKKDIGLYAMNYGNTYVASTAIYSDYTQVLHAIMEADRFNGPSIVLAHLPCKDADVPALQVLQETKVAVDSGYWPLYRWDPSRSDDVFRLDGTRIREQLREFLDRNNHLSLLAAAEPELPYDLAASQGTALRERQKRKAREAYESMLGALEGPPLLVLFASDGGGAEKLARKFAARGAARGLATRALAMDDFPLDELSAEQNVVFILSTAGQGEPPQNARLTFKALARLPANTFNEETRFAVFGMGDSHYWPRPEDAHFYNKPAKDLDRRLNDLGASRMANLGLGDDQDADGWQTGYREWEPTVWKALGVDSVTVTEAEPEPITNEHIKLASNYLRGTIKEGLADDSTGRICDTDTQLTKFHGTYMQWDRDTLEERKAAGLEPQYGFLIRVRMPGGVCTPEQWLALDDVAEKYGGIKSLKITTRQTIQHHMVLKKDLKKAIAGINKSMLDTIAACGDVNRTVMCTSIPELSNLHEELYAHAKLISDSLLPRMNAYHEIWLDKTTDSSSKMIAGGVLQDYEPMYGPYYLPRKFKIGIVLPPRNDVDVYTQDIGLVAIPNEDKTKIAGYNVLAGGGMGVTHSMKSTYPRLGSALGFVTPDKLVDVCRTIVLIQKDTGNRQNRKQARLKYTIDKYWGGPEAFTQELERRLGYKLEPVRPFKFTHNTDHYGWVQDYKGNWHCTLWLENGRVIDEPGSPFRTGLRELAKFHRGTFRLTPNQHIIVSDVAPADKPRIEEHLRQWKMANWESTGLRTSASACVALPTCGLAMAESERYLFKLVDKVEKIYLDAGLDRDEIVMRMTGCPNGCARPWVAEIAFVGKAPGSYMMLLGGGHAGDRLNKIFRDSVNEAEILEILGVLIPRYAKERLSGERFGDWVIRAGIIAPTTSGKEFYDNVDTSRPLPVA
ncbi:assimilatory sulfite reductase (NADPH) [Malassezia cuniculi]|uniref:assimilatory sulfite reductase (NADPH) n=1 Tax=Malassezia cuniculi TaxID=948313 RepID=A0AAF0J6C7_9BASI|nr:assimilatory sulfite reductase (NADPH) [Malassezia cuniculi]